MKKKASGIMRQIAELEKLEADPEEAVSLAEKVKEKIKMAKRKP